MLPDVRLLLIGNGKVGKTQIARWLAGKSFEPIWNSTHGIQLGARTASRRPTSAAADLGFRRSGHLSRHACAVPAQPGRAGAGLGGGYRRSGSTYEHGGLTFRNHPLAYWIDLVRHQGHPDSPVLILQSKCDRPEQEVLPFPIPEETLEALAAIASSLHVSAKEQSRAGGADGGAERVPSTGCATRSGSGVPQIGAGRLRVQRRLEALRDADMALPCEQRRHRLLERPEFEAICAEEGGVTDPALLLAYLDANGTVFYRPGLFGDRIVLDQSWALEAIYAVFDRKQVYRGAPPGRRALHPLAARAAWSGRSTARPSRSCCST